MAATFDFSDAVRVVDRLVASGEVAGAALAVAHESGVVLAHHAGEAAPGRPAGPDTLWPIASVSKLYTAATIVTMLERGELTLRLAVGDVLPRVTGDKAAITLRQLLTHTAGLPLESAAMARRLAEQVPLEQMIAEAQDEALLFPPGTRQSYSDYGYGVAARMASQVAGKPFPQLVRERVLEPAGLTETFFPLPHDLEGRVATVRGALAEGTDGAMYNSRYARDLAHPASGVIASVADMLRFGLAIAAGGDGPLLSDAGRRAMTTDQTGGDWMAETGIARTGVVHPWGIGAMLKADTGSPDLVSPQSWGHSGGTGCILWSDPAFGITVAFASNSHLLGDGVSGWLGRLDRVVNSVMACATR